MSIWPNPHETEVEDELRQERDTFHDKLLVTRDTIKELQRQIGAQRRYIEELEKQLEAGVVNEIREQLNHDDKVQLLKDEHDTQGQVGS
jgi:uncharacterized coiled-coil DUF342 family protein